MLQKLRDIENSFNNKYGNIYIEPTLENLKLEIVKVVEYLNKYDNKSQSLRELKLILILDEL